jgi:trehalose-phosphatase
MNDSLNDSLEQMVAQYRRGQQLVLLFAYDGALTDLSVRPWQATLPPATRRTLSGLTALPRVTVGVISGRELDELKSLVGLQDIFYAGTDGLELDFHGQTVCHPLVHHSIQLVSRVARALEPHLHDFPTAWLERKQFGLSVHYRRLDPQIVPLLHSRVEQALADWAERLYVVTGAKAVEITPKLGWTKGTAVEFVLEHVGPEPCVVLYAGDEAGDVNALWEVSIHGGITIGVGSPHHPTTAQFELRDAEAIRHLLDELCQGLGCVPSMQETGFK